MRCRLLEGIVSFAVCLGGTNRAKKKRGSRRINLQSLENKYAEGYAKSPLSSCGKALMLRA